MTRQLSALLLLLFVCTAALAQADRQSARLDQDYTFTYTNPCSGETFVIQSHIETYTRLMTDGSGGVHYHINGVWHFRATSPSGIEYVGTETENWSILTASGGTYNETYEDQGHLVSKGQPNNLFIHTKSKLVITPDGNVHIEPLSQTVDCRG